MNAPENYRTEVVPYEDAPWAPRLTGHRFCWAWRVVNEDGSVLISGASNGAASEAREAAENAARRRIANNRGVLIPRRAVVRKPRGRGLRPFSDEGFGDESASNLNEDI